MKSHDNPLRAGVIGNPVAHSRSPRLFHHWFEQYGIAGEYTPLLVEAPELEATLRRLPGEGFAGCNVTIPHKERALDVADVVTETAARIGAANTLTFGKDGEIQADNTDAYGFISNLRHSASDWTAESGPALVLGTGGATRAILAALLDAGAPKVILANRTRSRAEDLARAFGPKIDVIDWADIPSALPYAATVVNATSLGMAGHDSLQIDLSGVHPNQLVTDIVYTPLDTGLLVAARAAGCRTVDGLGMLLHQAVPGFARWFGPTPEVTQELRQAVLA